ncbi:hypothetical protein ACFY36_20860 [Actinoplanes sp. NPDC000266]
MALGLPIAVSIGWSLAAPAKRPAAVGLPGGEGALGSAPRPADTTPMTTVRYSPRPDRPVPATPTVTPSAPVTSAAATPSATATAVPATTTTPAPATTTSEPPLPPLTLPPVPTPTEITTTAPPSEPADPSTGPSPSAT